MVYVLASWTFNHRALEEIVEASGMAPALILGKTARSVAFRQD